MSYHLSSSPSLPYSRSNTPLFMIILMVIALHLVLLAIGTFWNPAPPAPKPRTKVIVQTVRLNPLQSTTVQNTHPIPAVIATLVTPPSNPPIEQPKADPLPIVKSVKEDIPPQPEIIAQKEEIPLIKEEAPPEKEVPPATATQEAAPIAAPSAPPAAISPPLPVKTESKPQSKVSTPKPALQEIPKPTKQAAPVKKPIEPAKKQAKNEAVKSKQAEEAEKKRQQEQAEKKRQQEQAEKKRQQEIAEAERKRQQEIAAAQEAARQKEQAVLAKAKENLAKMSETRNKISSSSSSSTNLEATTLPKELEALQVEALPFDETGSAGNWGSREISYSDEVAYRLKMSLKLPDYGAVKIKLSLDRTGKVTKVETVQSESSKNKAYVESKIPTLLFPSFGQRFQGVSQNTFVITLQNDS